MLESIDMMERAEGEMDRRTTARAISIDPADYSF